MENNSKATARSTFIFPAHLDLEGLAVAALASVREDRAAGLVA